MGKSVRDKGIEHGYNRRYKNTNIAIITDRYYSDLQQQ